MIAVFLYTLKTEDKSFKDYIQLKTKVWESYAMLKEKYLL